MKSLKIELNEHLGLVPPVLSFLAGEISDTYKWWQLVRKTPVPNSTSKTWQEQQALLSEKEETPTARVMVYTIIGHFLATGERLFENVYARCSDVDSDGYRVYVGYFSAYGLVVSYVWDGRRSGRVGVASVRKFS
jgi:hypothetical protein